MPSTLAIDFGSKYIGIALVSHPEPRRNQVLYAATLVVDAKPLNALVENRAQVRRLRRTRKTHRMRLRRLAQALAGIANAGEILRFCRRRGFSYDVADDHDQDSHSFHCHRSAFFQALRAEVSRLIPPEYQAKVLKACSTHLNESCRKEAEIRRARFENRGPTRCNWAGCNNHVPRAGNDFKSRLQQTLFGWLVPVFAESPDRDRLRRSIDHWITVLEGCARGYVKFPQGETRKEIDARVKKTYKNLLARVPKEASHETAEKFKENWQEHYRKAVSAILRGEQSGRVRYCRRHSEEFVNYRLAGKVIPNREDITEADLVSRKQQIVFARIWRLVESRLLPLAGGTIDRVVVERVAFDVLAGPFKARLELPPDKASAMYWHGPQLGFTSRLDMLREEFGSRCAYCGNLGATEQVEHLLPRSAFPFDSYFNILPACAACNARKGARTPLEAGMVVHPEAYEAFGEYIRKRKVPHVYHTIKKGLLNLLRRPSSSGEAERRLAMLANDLVTITATQRSPRPLARYLAGKLEKRSGRRPAIAYRAGRHTALYRSALLPEFDKQQVKEEQDLRNHAVDAIVLGCDLPSASALENKEWRLGAAGIGAWFESVRAAAPETLLGLPRVEPVKWVPFFEEDLGGGYCSIDLSAFNWNRKRKATHQLDPFGQTKDGKPLKRVPAASVLEALRDPKTRVRQIELIAHSSLRMLLREDPDQSPANFVGWLQRSIRADKMGNHPTDKARQQILQRFALAPVEKVVSGDEPIPGVIGIRCINLGSVNKLGVSRVDSKGRQFQYYQAQPVVREVYVGYRLRDGELDRKKPVEFTVSQSFEVRQKAGGKQTTVDVPEGNPLRGRPLGSREPLKEFLARWQAEFAELCARHGVVKVFRITQGCVIEKTNGTRFQFRNFDKGGAWRKAASFQEIRRVYRSPLQA